MKQMRKLKQRKLKPRRTRLDDSRWAKV